jgi:hypothetical protein
MKLFLLALAPLALLANPASAQTTVQRTVERPDGSVTRTVTRDNGYNQTRTVVRDRTDGYQDRRTVVREVRDGNRGLHRGRAMRRCWTTWRHHHRVRTCTVRRARRY